MQFIESQKKLPYWLGIVLVALIWLIYILGHRFGQTIVTGIEGTGLAPTVDNKDIVVASPARKFERFDLIIYRLTNEQVNIARGEGILIGDRKDGILTGDMRIGRVIGLPTELVEVKIDGVFINDNKITSFNTVIQEVKTFPKEQIPIRDSRSR